MNKEIISDKQGISIMILFLIGSTSIFVPGLEAKNDAWLAVILSVIAVMPMLFIFARLDCLFPNKDIFDIIELCFGKFIGKIVILIFTWYTFYWAADVLNNYALYVTSVNLIKTPPIVSIIFLGILCSWGIREGVELLGRWSKFFLLIPIVSLIIVSLLSIPKMNINNLKPMLYEGTSPLFEATFALFSQPFGQMIAFTMAFNGFRNKKSSSKVYFTSLLVAGLYMLLLTLTNILALGGDIAANKYYPTYNLATRIGIGILLQNLEILISLAFVLGGFIKVSILLLCVCKGITKVFECNDYRFTITPITLLILNLTYLQYDSVMDYMEFNSKVWPYYFFPFQVILPIFIFIFAEIKYKKKYGR
ncbi:GerAB/ArcD/ProY family transporter [Tepidibacter aestuarii]|uniref:GerAB/ArcD/ProY family transporter n=1 Tax=Tepidibacter aestuarii TaxID=2925782 RepID=UPI0020BF45B4|nr:endospore germination permease [Tepidibacter aestuarii]CAH2212925.1 spore germination protein KB [Tepidibacter aestuarii]